MTARRLGWAAAATAAFAVAVSPVVCSQASDTGTSRCNTLFGYGTPFSEEVQLLLVVAVVLAVAAVRQRRRDRP